MASSPSPAPSGVRSPSFPPSVRDPQFSRRNPRSNLPVADTAALLLRAAYEGEIPQIKTLAKWLRKAGKSVEEAMAQLKGPQYKGQGPLHMAAWAGKAAMCKFLIKDLKLDFDAAGDDGLTPLILAINGRASTAVARILLNHRADLNKEDNDGLTPLHAATPNRVAHIMHTPEKAASSTYSLEGLGLPTKPGADAMTPLIAAATAGSADCIKCLLKAGADPNVPYHNGTMPIEIAAVRGLQECVEVLFPVTTPLARVADWSTAGIIQHAKLTSSKLQDVNDGSYFDREGDGTYYNSDYAHALALYTMALENNPNDSTLYAKRSLCSLHIGDKGKALDDAKTYKDMHPDLSKSCYAQGAALILVKEYGRATEALMSGLNLDFGTKPAAKAT